MLKEIESVIFMKSNIKNIRTEKGLSIGELARISGVSKSYISEMEKGKKGNPSIKILRKISEALDVGLKDLF